MLWLPEIHIDVQAIESFVGWLASTSQNLSSSVLDAFSTIAMAFWNWAAVQWLVEDCLPQVPEAIVVELILIGAFAVARRMWKRWKRWQGGGHMPRQP